MAGILINRATGKLAWVLHRIGLEPVNHAAKRMLRKAGRDRLRVRSNGLVVEGPMDSWSTLNQIASGRLEPYEVELFTTSLRPGMTVLDVGANIGFYSLLAGRAVGPSGQVFAFEPDPRTAKSLRANVVANGLTTINVFERVVSDRAGQVELLQTASAPHTGLFPPVSGEAVVGVVPVEAVVLDDVLDGVAVDVMKLDVEGHEPAVLRGMEQTLERSPSLRLFLEYSPPALARAGEDAAAFLQRLRELFASVRVIDERTGQLVEPTPDRLGRLANLMCSRTD